MAPTKRCPICDLGEEDRQAFESRLSMGLPATNLAEFLGKKGISITPRQVDNHKRHSKPKVKEPKHTTLTPAKIIKCASEDGLTTDQIQERLLKLALEATDSLYEQLRDTGDTRVARVFKEVGEWASQLVKDRMDREEIPEPQVSVSINLMSLEEQLGLPEADL